MLCGGTIKRLDFYFTGLKIVLEVKTTVARHGRPGKLSDELHALKAKLEHHPAVSWFLVFIYDPARDFQKEKKSFVDELEKSSRDEFGVKVVIVH